MKKLKAFTITFVVLLSLLDNTSELFSQPLHQGQWKTYTAMSDITDLTVVRSSGNIWAATTGGAFRLNPSDTDKTHIFTLRNSDGLSDNNLTAVASDSGGRLYFGGSSGTVDVYTEATSKFNAIRDIAQSSYTHKQIYSISIFGSRVYIATGFGLSIYDTTKKSFVETITRFGTLLPQDTVFAVTEANDSIYVVQSGAIAIAAKNAPNLSDPSAWRIVFAPSDNTLNCIDFFKGLIVVGGHEGIYTIAGDSLHFIPMPDSITAVRISSLKDTLYILDSRGGNIITTTDAQHFSFAPLPGNLNGGTISSFGMGNSNIKIFGDGIAGIVLLPSSGEAITKIFPDGPLVNYIADLDFAGSLGKLFVCLKTIGMSIFEPDSSRWRSLATNEGALPLNDYSGSYYDTVRSTLWINTGGGGLYSLASANPTAPLLHFDTSQGIPSFNPGLDDYVVTTKGTLDNHGNYIFCVFAGNGKGLVKTSDGKTFTAIQLNPPNNANAPFGVCAQDQDDIYYAGTVDIPQPIPFGVIAVSPSGSTIPIAGGNGQKLGSPSVNALIIDQDNGAWCGTNVGVDVLTHSTDQTGQINFNSRVLPFTDQQLVRAIAVDGVGNKWVGTDDGVFVLSADGSDSLAHFTTANSPLIDNSVLSIAIDTKKGEAYIGTPSGISRVSSIYQEGATDYSKMYVYPNPVIQHSDDNIKITITGLAGGSTVKIFSVSGRLVATIDGSQLGSTVTWNGRDDNNKLLASGVYIAAAASPVTSEYGETKFVLIRK
jgi:hypothetical protein